MATRYYFPASTSADVSPSYDSGWNGTGTAVRRKLASTKGSSSIADGSSINLAGVGGRSMLDRQYVSEPLAAQTISGTVKCQLLVRESANDDNIDQLQLSIRVCSYDGSSIRGTLLSKGNYGPTAEYATSQRNKKAADGDSLSSLAVQAGDRLVIEIGHSNSTTGTTPSAIARWGENATDLPEDETTTSDGAGWIEFSGTIALAPNLVGVAPKLARGAFPPSTALDGFVFLGRGVPPDLYPQPVFTAWMRKASGPASFVPPESALRGRVMLGRGTSENLYPQPVFTAWIRKASGPASFVPPESAHRGRAKLGRGVPSNTSLPGAFVSRGYVSTHVYGRAPALGPLEVVRFEPSYVLPYLGTGVSDELVARGPLDAPTTWRTIALGKLRLLVPDTPGSLWIRTRVSIGAFPPRKALEGRAFLGRGIPDPFVPSAHAVLRPKLWRALPPFPDQVRGRSALGRGVPDPYVPPSYPAWAVRTARPPLFPVPILRGTARLGRGISADIAYLPYPIPSLRFARPVPPHPEFLRGRARTHGITRRITLLAREAAFLADLDAFAKERYRVIARNVTTGDETLLGEGLEISGVAIPDGEYGLRVEADGRFWRGVRYLEEWPVSIVAGELAAALPPILGLATALVGSTVYVTWSIEVDGYSVPEDVALWTSATSPVDTSAAPVSTVPSIQTAGYLIELAASPSTLFVAAAARKGASMGPVSETSVPQSSALGSPSGPSARQPDGNWSE